VQAGLLLNYLRGQGIDLKGLTVFDIGCGHGGYSQVFEDHGANVISSDFERISPEFFDLSVTAGKAFQADAMMLPLKDDCLDFTFCASLIEHVPEPARLLSEIWRTLRPGGKCYLSFPPFYTPIGGHQFKPFHLLGEKQAISIYKRRHRDDIGEDFSGAFGAWGLYPRTIRGVRRQLDALGFITCDQSTRYLPINVSRVPWLSEFLTWHVQFLIQKPDQALT
jgi:SAM-dependent methyltransferase